MFILGIGKPDSGAVGLWAESKDAHHHTRTVGPVVSVAVAGTITLFSLFRRGGAAIGQMRDGELLNPERKLLETPEPPVYQGLVIGVTTGAIEQLNRDELQRKIGHEFRRHPH